MLSKLLKYDLKWIYKVVIVFYALALVFSVLARIFLSIDNSMLFNILGQITAGFAAGMMISSLINGIMRSWVRFIRNIYKDESYLTHTLPVEKKTIYLSKVLAAIITSFITIVVIGICLAIIYLSKDSLNNLKTLLELTATTYNTTIIKLLLVMFCIIFLEILFVILIGYAGIIIGHRSNQNKMIKSVIISFAMYAITSALSLGVLGISALFNKSIMNIIKTSSTVKIDAIKSVLLISLVLYIVYNVAYYFIGKKEFEKGVNVD